MNHKNLKCVITGCSSGIGRAAARELLKQGHHVIMLVRESQKSRLVYNEFRELGEGSVDIVFADLASLKEIESAAEQIKSRYEKLDVLINNAAVINLKKKFNENGVELTRAVNYLAPFQLTGLLLPLLRKSGRGRVVNVSSMIYTRGKENLDGVSFSQNFDPYQVYADSKKLLNYFTIKLANDLENKSVTVNAVHPGIVATNVVRDYPFWVNKLFELFFPKPISGARPLIYLATSSELDGVSGIYFNKTKRSSWKNMNLEPAFLQGLWEDTEKFIASGQSNIRI